MFGSLGAPEFLIIGAVIILLFGVGKISGLGKELGGSIKEFRRAVKDEDSEAAKKKAAEAPPAAPPVQYTQVQQPAAPPPQQTQYAPPPAPSAPPQQPQGPQPPEKTIF